MSLVISEELLQTSEMTETELMLEIVIIMFQREKISLGKANSLLGIHRQQLPKILADRGICVHYDLPEFEEDLKGLSERKWIKCLWGF